MRIPESLSSLLDHGIIERVVRPLMSGKEAQIHLIESGGVQRVAKVYKDAQQRTFQNRADYTEGRKVRNSRDQRAMDSRSKHGRAKNEAAWKTAEVDMIYRLRAAGVRVPEPYNFIDGVLIMELVSDAEGDPAPRLGDLSFEPEEATRIFHALLAEVVRMLCAGVVHGDLSDFNVLLSAEGPVIIDFPQACDASGNQNARKLLLRDVDNLHRFHAKFAPEVPRLPYAEEMWDLYQRNALTPETRLTGKFRGSQKAVNTEAVLGLIADANHDERRRREKLGLVLRDKVPPQRASQGRSEPRRHEPRAAQQQLEPRTAPRVEARSPRQNDAHPGQRHAARSAPGGAGPRFAQRELQPAERQAEARSRPPQREEPRSVQHHSRTEQREPRSERVDHPRSVQGNSRSEQRDHPRSERRDHPRSVQGCPRSEQRDHPRSEQRDPRSERRDHPRSVQRNARSEQRDEPRSLQRNARSEQRDEPRSGQREPRAAHGEPRTAQRHEPRVSPRQAEPRSAKREQARDASDPRGDQVSSKWGQRTTSRSERGHHQSSAPRRPLDGPLQFDPDRRDRGRK